jgi:hypothetical protein
MSKKFVILTTHHRHKSSNLLLISLEPDNGSGPTLKLVLLTWRAEAISA